MNNKIIDLEYVKNEQKTFLEHLKSVKGINCQDATYNVPYWLILALQTELSEIINAKGLHKWWNNEAINNEHVIEECVYFLAHLGNLANLLDADLILELEEIQVTAAETTFNRLAYWITTLNSSKRHARNTLIAQIIPEFIELIYSLGFNLEELEEAYYKKLKSNYENPKFNQEVEQCQNRLQKIVM
jgi:dimeric dUTPase (all-alpha-NTP-PPase superfamily)